MNYACYVFLNLNREIRNAPLRPIEILRVSLFIITCKGTKNISSELVGLPHSLF